MALYAGFDCSTQSLSVIVIDTDAQAIAYQDATVFDRPFLPSSESGVVHAEPRMWADALRAMLGRLAARIDRRRLAAISGAAQQHGSVYCGRRPLDLTRETSPIWMDSSTGAECAEIEAALGGANAVAQLTGSRAFPRFTGPQIRRFWRREPDAYGRTSRIHLVSSFLASVLIGDHAPIDHADGSGMNLMDLRTGAWASRALDATAPALGSKLPSLVPSSSTIGILDAELQRAFDLPPAHIVAWSGDNPSSMVGTGVIREGELAISLGTSDTIFGPMTAPSVSRDGTGHVFASPLGEFMGITVFRNGSLARDRVRESFGMSWPDVSEALRTTPAGNDGGLMLPWFEAEITPTVANATPVRAGLEGAPPARHVRALVEGQLMAIRRHSAWMKVKPQSIRATGGASANREILQIMADVFGVPVTVADNTGSAALGAALRAWQAHAGVAWPEVIRRFIDSDGEAKILPVNENVTTYRALQERYIALEKAALSGDRLPPP